MQGDALLHLAHPASTTLSRSRVVYACNYDNKWDDSPFQPQLLRLLARCMPRGALLVTFTSMMRSGRRFSAAERALRAGDGECLAALGLAPSEDGGFPALPQLMDTSLAGEGVSSSAFYHSSLCVEVSGGWPEGVGGEAAWRAGTLQARLDMLRSAEHDEVVTNTFLRGRLTQAYAAVKYIIDSRKGLAHTHHA